MSNSLIKTQFDILFANSPWLITGQLLLATTILFWLYGQVPPTTLFVWYGLTFVPPLYRAYLSYDYQLPNKRPINYWKYRYLIGSFSYGIVWSSLVFFDLPLLSFYFILFILSGYLVVTVSASSVYLPAVTYFIFPVGTLVSIRCLQLELAAPNENWSFILLIVLFSIFVVLFSARVLNRAIVSGLKVRFENTELVNSLKKQQAEIEAARNAAEKANQDKSRFLAAASHDLRQPLHAMSLFLDAIRNCDEKQERMGLYEKLEKSVESLAELFNALLDISKIDAEAIDIQPITFSISDIMQKVVNEFEIEANKKGLSINYRPTCMKVYSDPLWLERIIRNLVSNAIRYTDSGRILLACRTRGENCLMQIWDTGHGITKEQQEIIFQEFTQINNDKRNRNNGLGLGLAIVKRLAKLLNHKIGIASTFQKGSVFSITLPLSSHPIENIEATLPTKIEDNLLNKTILILDDEPDVRSAMAAMLTKWGCNVLMADSTASFFNLLDNQNDLPALIISDYQLNDNYTGLEALQKMKKSLQMKIPAILITGETEASTIRTINNSNYKVLHKPVRPAKLRIMLNSLLTK